MKRLFTMGCSLFVLTLIAAGPARAGEPSPVVPPSVTVPISAAAPKLDGVIGENEWTGPVLQGFFQLKAPLMDRRGGRFALACDGTNLYVAVETPVHPRFGPVARNGNPNSGVDPEDIVYDDSVEMWLAAGLTGEAEYAYQAMFTTPGGYTYRRFVDPSPNINFFTLGWEIKGFARCSVIRGSTWTLEVAIPLEALGTNVLGAGVRLRVCRNYQLPFVQSRDNPNVVYYKDPSTMMQVRFQESAPMVSEPNWVGQKSDKAVLTLRNPAPAAMKVLVAGTAVELAPGATQQVPVAIQGADKNTRQAEVTVTTQDGTVIHRRTAKWIVTDEQLWEEVL